MTVEIISERSRYEIWVVRYETLEDSQSLLEHIAIEFELVFFGLQLLLLYIPMIE